MTRSSRVLEDGAPELAGARRKSGLGFGGNAGEGPGRRVMDLLWRLRGERGLTIVLVTHDLESVARADRAIRILDGKVLLR